MMTTDTTAKKVTTQAITKALHDAGFVSYIRTRHMRREGYQVRKINRHAVAVDSSAHGKTNEDVQAWSEKYAQVLDAAGFIVERPFPDTTILGIKVENNY